MSFRKHLIIKFCALTLSFGISSIGLASDTGVDLLIGTYTNGTSEGIYRTHFSPKTMTFSKLELVFETDSPSFLAIDKPNQRVFAVNEVGKGTITALQWEEDVQKFSLINQVSSLGAYPCYINYNPQNQMLSVANYGTGSVGVYQMQNTGIQEPALARFQHSGKGPNAQRQEGPHAHWVGWNPNNDTLFAVDLGIDKVMLYSEIAKTPAPENAIQLNAADGPRHLAFHPTLGTAYILNELSNTITVAKVSNDGSMNASQRLNTLPSGFNSHSQAAHITLAKDNNVLYVSNRGHNSIAAFKVAEDGSLALLQIHKLRGDWPRHFSLVANEQFMVIANKNSDSLELLKVHEDGTLSGLNTALLIDQPVFVAEF